VTKAEAAVEVHLADSLSGLELATLRDATRIADMGAGAGFPGLVLAAALPAAEVDLIESTARKAGFIEQLAAQAGIGNARAVPARVEEWGAGEGREAYAAVTARALAALPVLVEYAAPLLAPGGTFVAWKGARDAREEAAGEAAAAQVGLAPVDVRRVKPFPTAEQRHLHVYSKTGPTPERFPRRPGIARKRPLA
jgi:16S rRNA (guanine527-N7)-methyltransferase